jgi:ribose/xylose/arabinose/galactoside ABC-type transport system permease subunit/ABC-type sugar transport system substrate-binding protein
MRDAVDRFLRERLGALLALAALCILFAALSPRFLALDNFLNVARQISLNGIIAVGMTLVIVSGGIDLSVGSVLALATCVSGLLMQGGSGPGVALAAGLGTGLACGAVNGVVITRLGISPFITTLGMMSFARGAAMVLTDGNPIARLDRAYFFLGTGTLLGVPWPVWVMAVVAAFGAFLLARTRLGRYALAIGSNEEAVRLAGIPVAAYKLMLYVIMGGLCAVAGWILSARVASADPSSGVLMELEAIAAVVIGGASLRGGRGSVTGTLVGAAIMGVLSNGLVLLGISAFWQQVLVGAVIVAAVAVDQLKARASATPSRSFRRVAIFGFAALVLGAVALTVFRPAPKSADRLTIAIVGKASGGEYWLAVKAGAERKGRELGVEVLWQGTPSETDVAKQIDLVENLIQRRVDGIAVAPTDASALSPIIANGLKAGIPIVTVDSDSAAKDRHSYIGTDNRAAGVLAGQEMVRLLGGRGKVAIVTGVLGAQNLRQRCDGFREGIAGSQLELLAEQSDGGDRAKALAIAENVLVANPDVAGFFADTAIGGPAVAQALIARGLVGKVKVLSFDTTPALLGYLDEGAVQGLVAQKPERMGELAVEMLVDKARGKDIPPLVDTGVEIVKKP